MKTDAIVAYANTQDGYMLCPDCADINSDLSPIFTTNELDWWSCDKCHHGFHPYNKEWYSPACFREAAAETSEYEHEGYEFWLQDDGTLDTVVAVKCSYCEHIENHRFTDVPRGPNGQPLLSWWQEEMDWLVQ